LNLDNYIRKHIKNIPFYEGVDPSIKLAEESGILPEDIIKLNANENPFGKTLALGENLSSINIHEYPDPNQKLLRKSLSKYTGKKIDQLVAGSGSDELIDILIRIFLDQGDKLIDAQPTFGMYEFFAKIQGANVVSVPRDENFNLDLESILNQIDKSTKMIFLASPNNPTGNLASLKEIKTLLESELIVVVDETYFEFANKSYSGLIDDYENLVILRSFSKWAGLAGLRIGYAISNPKLIQRMLLIKQPYNINSAAEQVAILAMNKKKNLLTKVEILIEQKELIFEFLKNKKGLKAYPSSANFILCDFGQYDSNDVFNQLAQKGIFVRKFSNKLISNCLRISSGTPDQTGKLLQVLDNIIS
tara:strand:+ start:6149 stop:7231 length:1083 start_codon:yes stop_codon:yes gene_type:complete